MASVIKGMQAQGRYAEARESYGELIRHQQRRALTIAYRYLRDVDDADEAAQTAFVKAYMHLPSFRRELVFEGWFTRILVNECLDRVKIRARRRRWLVSVPSRSRGQPEFVDRVPSGARSPEELVLARERGEKVADALTHLPERQRAVFLLIHDEGLTFSQVSSLTGLSESTVRVHLFRAIRRLRALLADCAHEWTIDAACGPRPCLTAPL